MSVSDLCLMPVPSMTVIGGNNGLGDNWCGNNSLVNCRRPFDNGVESVVMVCGVVNGSDAL